MSEDKIQEEYDLKDIEKNNSIAGLAYFVFFLPLIAAPNSKFARFHGNQGLLLFITALVGYLVMRLVPVIGIYLTLPFRFIIVIFAIRGLVAGINGEVKELPLIGKYRLLKG